MIITKSKFITELKNLGSDLSIQANTNILGGVNGMPVTHQIGFGAALRQNINPNFINVDVMNNEVHFRMTMVIAGFGIAKKLYEDELPLLSLLPGVAGFKELTELYDDWKAGFEAAEMLGDWYWRRMHPELFSEPAILPNFSLLGNHPSPGTFQMPKSSTTTSRADKLRRRRMFSTRF